MIPRILSALYGHLMNLQKISWIKNPVLLKPDSNAKYAATIEIDLNEIKEPLLACPNDPDDIKTLSEISKSNGLKFHMDGARIWHAILTDPQSIEYGKYCDSLTFCFSKGLGAPIGSMLMGDKNFINDVTELIDV